MPSFPCVASLQDASPAEWKMDFASTTQIHLRRRRNKVTVSALTFPRCSGSSQSSHNLSTSECARRTKCCHVATFIKKKLTDDNHQKVKWPNFQATSSRTARETILTLLSKASSLSYRSLFRYRAVFCHCLGCLTLLSLHSQESAEVSAV